jgi:polysaccharide pyruvyl transferase WcaK-like protein
MLRRLAKQSKVFCVRDLESVKGLEARGIEAKHVVDPAVIALGASKPSSSRDDGHYGFIPFAAQTWPFLQHPTQNGMRAQQAEWRECTDEILAHRPRSVVIIPFTRTDTVHSTDIQAAIRERSPQLPVSIAEYQPADPFQALSTLSSCEGVITMRYHGFMASYFAGVPRIKAVGASQKLTVAQQLSSRDLLRIAWDPHKAKAEVSDFVQHLMEQRG